MLGDSVTRVLTHLSCGNVGNFGDLDFLHFQSKGMPDVLELDCRWKFCFYVLLLVGGICWQEEFDHFHVRLFRIVLFWDFTAVAI